MNRQRLLSGVVLHRASLKRVTSCCQYVRQLAQLISQQNGVALSEACGNSRQGRRRFKLILRYFFRRFESEIATKGVGSTFTAINRNNIEQLRLVLPSLDEQRRIVAFLDEAEALRQLRARADARMAEFIQALFNQMFGDPTTNPKGWPIFPLGDITSIESAMVDPREEQYLDLLHVGGDKIESNTGELLPANTAREDMLISSKFLFDEHDVLYCKIRPYLRKVALPTRRGLCSADIYPLRPQDGKLTREYLWMLLLSEAFTKYTESFSKRANMPKINREQLGAYSAMLPPLALRREFAARVAEVRAMQDQQVRVGVRLEEGFQAMLHEAFNGEL